jgi:hypothetical protein
MTTNTVTQRFPLDDLLQCGQCGGPLHLGNPAEPVYTCAGSTDKADRTESCPAPALRAEDLNRLVISQVMSVIITDSTFHTVREAVGGALAEAGHDATEADELCRNAASVPEWLMTAEQAPEGGEVLARFIDRIRVEPGTAEVEYRLPLPAGTPLAGTLRQTISLPESLLA